MGECRTHPGCSPDETITTGRVPDAIELFLADRNREYREALADELAKHGFAVHSFAERQSMFRAFIGGLRADLILLDWGLNDDCEGNVLAQLDTLGLHIPVVFMSGHDNPVYEKLALERGAADFVGKSRSTAVIAARLRRAAKQRSTGLSGSSSSDAMEFGRLVLRPGTNRAYWDGVDVELTTGEFRIVRLLASGSGSGSFFTYRQIYDALRGEGLVAGNGEEGYRSNVRSAIRRLRAKFRAVCADFDEIRNFRSFGYRWTGFADR